MFIHRPSGSEATTAARSTPGGAGCSSATLDQATRDEADQITQSGEFGLFRLDVADCLYDLRDLAVTRSAALLRLPRSRGAL